MEHIPKIFQAIQRLELKDSADYTPQNSEVTVGIGMFSPQEEYVPFAGECNLDGKVEVWLHRIIAAMRKVIIHLFT